VCVVRACVCVGVCVCVCEREHCDSDVQLCLWCTVTFAPLHIMSGTQGILCVLYETYYRVKIILCFVDRASYFSLCK